MLSRLRSSSLQHRLRRSLGPSILHLSSALESGPIRPMSGPCEPYQSMCAIHRSTTAMKIYPEYLQYPHYPQLQSATQAGHAAISLPTIRELRDLILSHAPKVYQGPQVEFNPSKEHDRSVGTVHALIPLASQPECWRVYMNTKRSCRFGVILEELDLLATYIGYKHNQDPTVPIGTLAHHTIGVVTARIDRIGGDMRSNSPTPNHPPLSDVEPDAHFRNDADIQLTGYVSWLGKSSMEVTIRVHQFDPLAEGGARPLMTAHFLMVTLGTDLKAAPNVALKVTTEEERLEFERGERAKDERIARDKLSLVKVLPNEEEQALLHQLGLSYLDKTTFNDHHSIAPPNHRFMDKLHYNTSEVCYPAQTNLHGTVFGGYLLCEAFDIAWSNAARFSKQAPACVGLTNVLFMKPVHVNSILHLRSQITYAEDHHCQVRVDSLVEDYAKGEFEVTNVFNFTFDCMGEVPSLIPRSYADCLRYLNGRREFQFLLSNGKKRGTGLEQQH